MPTLIPWTTVEIGDLDIFAPALPSLVVYTWYVDDEPESTVTFFWRDDDSGITHHELLLVAPVTFEEAVTHARQEAPKRNVERIHVRHARGPAGPAAKKAAPKRAAKAGPEPAGKAAPVRKAAAAKKAAPSKAKTRKAAPAKRK